MNSHFGDLLAQAVQAKRSAICVGLDPRWSSLPKKLTEGIEQRDRGSIARITAQFCCEVIDAVASLAPVVKPQAAFFEQLGCEGMVALDTVVRFARNAGMLVLLDGKRGDIGTTAQAYAQAYLGQDSGWGCDALTVNPYLGDDTLEPFVDCARERGAGIFVLVKTSNPGSGFLQDCRIRRDDTDETDRVYEKMADLVQSRALATVGTSGYGIVGAVVGATYPNQLSELRHRIPNAWILIPGYGAQGGTASDVSRGFDQRGLGAIVNSSRGIIFAYELAQYSGLSLNWQDAVASATRDMAEQLRFARSSVI